MTMSKWVQKHSPQTSAAWRETKMRGCQDPDIWILNTAFRT